MSADNQSPKPLPLAVRLLLINLSVIGFVCSLAWLTGYNFDERGLTAAFLAFVCVFGCLFVSMIFLTTEPPNRPL